MTTYEHLAQFVKAAPPTGCWDDVINHLSGVWIADYSKRFTPAQLVETTDSSFSYLFDLTAERLIAAWGISRGRHGAARDSTRMAGAPRMGGEKYHRGHAIAHRLGGGTDINLVPQLATINVGAFRRLEKEAVATPGALYFTHWIYGGPSDADGEASQIPTRVEQGLLVMGCEPRIVVHGN